MVAMYDNMLLYGNEVLTSLFSTFAESENFITLHISFC